MLQPGGVEEPLDPLPLLDLAGPAQSRLRPEDRQSILGSQPGSERRVSGESPVRDVHHPLPAQPGLRLLGVARLVFTQRVQSDAAAGVEAEASLVAGRVVPLEVVLPQVRDGAVLAGGLAAIVVWFLWMIKW